MTDPRIQTELTIPRLVRAAKAWHPPQSPMAYRVGMSGALLKRFLVASIRENIPRSAAIAMLITWFCDASDAGARPYAGSVVEGEPTTRISLVEVK